MQKNLLFKSKKCEFHKKEVNFLNFIVENDMICMNFAKVQAIKEWKILINLIEILSFINFTNYNKNVMSSIDLDRLSLERNISDI